MHHSHVLVVFAHRAFLFGGGFFVQFSRLFLRCLFDLGCRHPRAVQPVGFIPLIGIIFQLLQHARHVLPQTVLRGPVELCFGLRQIQLIVIAGNIHHPRANEGIFAEDPVFCPSPQFRRLSRNVPCHPILVVQLTRNQPLQFAEGDGFRLPQQNGKDIRQGLAAIDNTFNGIEQVVEVQERLPACEVPRVDLSAHPFLVDARDLLSEKGGMALIVVNPGRSQENEFLVSLLLMQHRFCADFRGAVGKFGIERRVFVYRVSGGGRGMGQHGGGENELFQLKVLETFEKPLAPLDGHRIIGGMVLSAEVKKRREMDAGSDAVAVSQSQPCQCFIDAGLVRDVETDAFSLMRRMGRRMAIQTNDTVFLVQPFNDRSPEISA